MGQGLQAVALCCLHGMTGMQQLCHDFASFLRGRGGESRELRRSTVLRPGQLSQGCIWPQMSGFLCRAGRVLVP